MFIGQFARANELDEWSHTRVKYGQRPLRSLHGNMTTLSVYMNARNVTSRMRRPMQYVR